MLLKPNILSLLGNNLANDSVLETTFQGPSPRKDLYEVFSHPEYSIRKKKKIIENLDEIDGFDITFLISHILNLDLMGHLNIVSINNEVSGITFGHGYISHIDLPDKKTYFGTLLLEDGLITAADLKDAIGQTDMQMGQYLLKKKIITEQQINDVFAKQMRLRLSKLICDSTFKVNFSEVSEPVFQVHITQLDYYNICHDWVAGRFSHEWLNVHFLPWENEEISFRSEASYVEEIFQMPMLQQFPNLKADLKARLTVKELIRKYNDNEALLLKIVYFLSMTSVVGLKSSEGKLNKKLNKLESIYMQLKNKKEQELSKTLSTLTKINENDTEAIYLSFLKLIEENSSDAELNYKNDLIKIGLHFLSYRKPVVAKGIATNNQISTTITERAMATIQQDLLTGKYYDAMGKLKKIYAGSEIVPSVKLHLIWAKLSHALTTKVKINLISCETDLIQVLPEDKETAEYFYARAILEKLKNNREKSIAHFNTAVKKKPLFAQHPIYKQSLFAKVLNKIGIKK